MEEYTKMNAIKQCCLCRSVLEEDNSFGHNPFPLCEVDDYESRACNRCNALHVIDARVECMRKDIPNPEEAAAFCRPLRNYIRRVEIAKHLLAVEAGDDKDAALAKFKERMEKATEQRKKEEEQLKNRVVA